MNTRVDRRDFMGFLGTGIIGAAGAVTPLPGNLLPAIQRPGTTVQGEYRLPNNRPNIVIFMPDAMRADSLSCYGNSITRTPNFDLLAKQGTRFSNCHVQFPVCGASRCSMLTGWPTSVRGHRSLYYFLRPEEPNVFRYLKQAGYDVYWFGKNDALAAQCFADSVTEWADLSPMPGLPPQDCITPGAISMLYDPQGDRRHTSEYLHIEMAKKILDRKQSDKPFCIFLPLFEPHPPYTISKDFYNLYSPSEIPSLIPAGLNRKPEFHEGMREMYGLRGLDDATFRKIRAIYYGKVSYCDWILGELMEKLESSGRSKDTALFVLSDHGDYAGDFGLIEKWPNGMEDCLTHVPLIGRVPGGKAGVVADDIVELFDIMQTSLDLAGAKANHTHFSRSLLPQMTGQAGDSNRAAYCEAGYNVYEPQCFEPYGQGGGPYVGKIRLQNEQPDTVSRAFMVRTRTHKLIRRPQGQSELYSYKQDPLELENLYGDGGKAAVQQELQTMLLDRAINTTGIAPMDKDPRDCPPFYQTRTDLTPANWQQELFDKKE